MIHGQNLAGIDPVEFTKPTVAEIGKPVTPEVAGLGRFGDLEINTSIGLLNLNIPIFTIKLKNYELPIYLSYTYSGLRVEDESSIVGLGWNLHAGGFVSREVRGSAPDEGGYYFQDEEIKRYYFGNFSNNTNIQGLNDAEITELGKKAAANYLVALWGDTKPDKFTFNITGLEGHYTHGLEREAIVFPLKPYVVQDHLTSNGRSELYKDGCLYPTFNRCER